MNPSLLIVDDDEVLRTQLRWALCTEYEIALAADRDQAMAQAREKQPDVVLLDLGLPPNIADPSEGFIILQDLLATFPYVKIIIITGQSQKSNALQAIAHGASDFIHKPLDVEELRIVLRHACYVAELERERRLWETEKSHGGFEGMIGDSPQMQQVFASIRKVATVNAPVLILGESGTGKEMVALAIHRLSRRSDGPFIAINCHAIPETLLEAELFGHEKGAFTGAHIQRIGRIEMAAAGTLLLDEIGELTPSLQIKLLRFLQDQTFERVGGRSELRVDTRIIAATHADLHRAMEQGTFREDLFFRIAVVTIRMPLLRERVGDVALLAHYFLQKHMHPSRNDLHYSSRALRAMSLHAWPGNVRELENRVRRAVIMADGKLIRPADLELESPSGVHGGSSLKEARERLERDYVRSALARSHGNISKAADMLDVSRPTLYEMIDKLGIDRPHGSGQG